MKQIWHLKNNLIKNNLIKTILNLPADEINYFEVIIKIKEDRYHKIVNFMLFAVI